MKASVRIANVYDEILEETTKELVVVANRKSFVGALFFRKEKWEKVKKVIDKVDVEGSALDIVLAAYNLKKKYGMLAKDDKTLQSMAHWQFVNGLTDEWIDMHLYKNDTEFLASLNMVEA